MNVWSAVLQLSVRGNTFTVCDHFLRLLLLFLMRLARSGGRLPIRQRNGSVSLALIKKTPETLRLPIVKTPALTKPGPARPGQRNAFVEQATVAHGSLHRLALARTPWTTKSNPLFWNFPNLPRVPGRGREIWAGEGWAAGRDSQTGAKMDQQRSIKTA